MTPQELINKAHEKITRIKGKEYAPNVHEIGQEIDKICARLWYEQRGFTVFDAGDETFEIMIEGYSIEISESELKYRADLWKEENEGNY